MKTSTLLTIALLTAPLAIHAADTKKKKPAPKPAAEKPAAGEATEDGDKKPAEEEAKPTKEQSALKSALENQSQLKGFHVEVALKTAEGNATLKGSLGEGTLSLDCTDVKGVKKKRIVAGGEFYLSADGGKTWKKGDDAEKDTTLLFNNIITAPINLGEQLLKENYAAKEEKLNGEDVLRLEKPAKGKDAAVNIWLCREPAMDNTVFIRKVDMIISGTDLELPATITYSKFTEPVKISAPEDK